MVVFLGNPVIAIVAIIVLIETNTVTALYPPPMLPNTYKDIFAGGHSGRPTLGTTTSTCWARGGICIDLRDCNSYFDASVAGCTKGFKVCCKMYKFGPPTVGPNRRDNEVFIYSSSLKELDKELIKKIAMKNHALLRRFLNNSLKTDDIKY